MLMPFGRTKLYFALVGTGRCGTVYFAQLLNLVGIPCSHERLFGPYGLEHTEKVIMAGGNNSDVAKHAGLKDTKFILAEASYMAVPYLNYGILADAAIIHIVRNPTDVILSFYNKLQYWHKDKMNRWEGFIAAHLPELKQYDNPLMKTCCYVVRWNQWIERQAEGRNYVRIRLEQDTDKLLHYLRIPKGLWPKLNKMNTHDKWKEKNKPLDHPIKKEDVWGSGFGNQVKLLTERYGYEG